MAAYGVDLSHCLFTLITHQWLGRYLADKGNTMNKKGFFLQLRLIHYNVGVLTHAISPNVEKLEYIIYGNGGLCSCLLLKKENKNGSGRELYNMLSLPISLCIKAIDTIYMLFSVSSLVL